MRQKRLDYKQVAEMTMYITSRKDIVLSLEDWKKAIESEGWNITLQSLRQFLKELGVKVAKKKRDVSNHIFREEIDFLHDVIVELYSHTGKKYDLEKFSCVSCFKTKPFWFFNTRANGKRDSSCYQCRWK